MIKGSIQEEDITIINIYAPNIGALQYVSNHRYSPGGIQNWSTDMENSEIKRQADNSRLVGSRFHKLMRIDIV